MTLLSSLIKIVVLPGHSFVPTLCAVTLAAKPSPSNAASTMPAVTASTLNELISLGTSINLPNTGVFVLIMYSSPLPSSVLLSKLSAGFPKAAFQKPVWIHSSTGKSRVSLRGFFGFDVISCLCIVRERTR